MKIKYKLNEARRIALGFLGVILLGTLLLMLPVATRSGNVTNFCDALFTAVSATCVTGLVVFDTFTHWSLFGQLVILMMIQVGGLGFMTIITLFALALRKKISLSDRKLLMQTAGSTSMSGLIRLILHVVEGTLAVECFGAVLLALRFVPNLGWGRGIYAAVFTAVSAFCNAGFDVSGMVAAGTSLTDYVADPVVCLTVMALIVSGGLGFLVWSDIRGNWRHPRKLRLHTKVVVATTTLLIVGGWVLFFFLEKDASMSDLSVSQRLLASLFQSVTPRTAGFNTVAMDQLSQGGGLVTMILMFIGGSPGSTAGGVKTTTFAVLLLVMLACARREEGVNAFRSRVLDEDIRQASSVAGIYLLLVLTVSIVIAAIEPFSMRQIMFEVISAIGTVGLSMGITPELSTLSQLLLAALMFTGRIGGMTLALSFTRLREPSPMQRPAGKILIG